MTCLPTANGFSTKAWPRPGRVGMVGLGQLGQAASHAAITVDFNMRSNMIVEWFCSDDALLTK